MPEETITNPEIAEENMIEIDTQIENASDTEEFAPKKRITRRRIRPRKKTPPVEPVDPAPVLEKVAKQEINEVLSNLYGERTEDDVQEIKMKESNGFLRASLFIALGGFFALVLWAGFFLLPEKSRDQSQIALAINGPTEISIGQQSTYSISYANNSSVPIKNVVLNTYFPEGFVYTNSDPEAENAGHNEWKLGTLEPYQKGLISVSGINFGSLNEDKSWRISLNYQPENFNSELNKLVTLTTTIAESPFKLTISGPDQVTVGSETRYSFFLQKNSDWNKQVSIIPEIPPNFSIVSSTPLLNKNKQWIVPPSSTDSQVFTLIGKFTGGEETPSPIKGKVAVSMNNQIYEIASAQLTSVLLKNDLGVSLAINGHTSDFNSFPGDVLNMTLRVKNASQAEIRNAIVQLSLLSPAKDRTNNSLLWAEFADKYDGTIVGEQVDRGIRRGTVTWTSAQIPALAKLKPNDEIVIDLKLPVRGPKNFSSAIGDQLTIGAGAEVSFKDASKVTQTLETKPVIITLNSDLTFTNEDDKMGSGVGEKHNISWTLNNTFHPLKNIVVSAQTYGDVSLDLLQKGAGELTYEGGKITWKIPEMLDETDVLNASFILTLNKYNPTQTLLLSKVSVTAEDTVTGKTISITGDEIKAQ